jgi:hypothetical protein
LSSNGFELVGLNNMKYEIADILKVRDEEESWILKKEVHDIWKRSHKKLRVYSFYEISSVNNQDESWIFPLSLVKIAKRKYFEKNN